MWIEFDSLPGHARVWIYQANRALTASEVTKVADALRMFCANWSAHGQPMKSSFVLPYNQFVVLAADEDFRQASGCSIDGSVRALQTVQAEIQIDFFDRTRVAFWLNNKIETMPVAELKEAFADGRLTPHTPMFNNLVASKADFAEKWKIPAWQSWLTKYFPAPAFT
jgi:hypothetical protein